MQTLNPTYKIQAEDVMIALKNFKTKDLFDMIQKYPIKKTGICLILDVLFKEISNSNSILSEFCLDKLVDLIEKFGNPVIIWIHGNVQHMEILEELLDRKELKDLTKNMLKLCLEKCSNNLNQIPRFTELWKKAIEVRFWPRASFPSANDSKSKKLLLAENFEKPTFNHLKREIANSNLDNINSHNGQFQENKELRFRQYFFKDEELKEDENTKVEYKKYFWRFSYGISLALKKTICGFLNRAGGRLYIGVNDKKRVVGIELTVDQRDEIKRHVLGLVRNFTPANVNTSQLLDVAFLPIKEIRNHQKIPGLFVMKIIVKPGNSPKLYSISKDILECYQRNNAETVLLRPDEFWEALAEREKSFDEKKKSLSTAADEKDFIDPEPESLVDI